MLVKSIEFSVGNEVIDKINSDMLYMWNEMTYNKTNIELE